MRLRRKNCGRSCGPNFTGGLDTLVYLTDGRRTRPPEGTVGLALIIGVVLASKSPGEGRISQDGRGGAGVVLGVLTGTPPREGVGGLLVVLALDLNPEQGI